MDIKSSLFASSSAYLESPDETLRRLAVVMRDARAEIERLEARIAELEQMYTGAGSLGHDK